MFETDFLLSWAKIKFEKILFCNDSIQECAMCIRIFHIISKITFKHSCILQWNSYKMCLSSLILQFCEVPCIYIYVHVACMWNLRHALQWVHISLSMLINYFVFWVWRDESIWNSSLAQVFAITLCILVLLFELRLSEEGKYSISLAFNQFHRFQRKYIPRYG